MHLLALLFSAIGRWITRRFGFTDEWSLYDDDPLWRD